MKADVLMRAAPGAGGHRDLLAHFLGIVGPQVETPTETTDRLAMVGHDMDAPPLHSLTPGNFITKPKNPYREVLKAFGSNQAADLLC